MVADFKLLTLSGSVQVNEDEIFVFGGTMENYVTKSDLCFVLRLRSDGTHIIERVNQYKLPIAEGFWNQQAFIHNNEVLAL